MEVTDVEIEKLWDEFEDVPMNVLMSIGMIGAKEPTEKKFGIGLMKTTAKVLAG